MHARIRERSLPETVGTRMTVNEKSLLEERARQRGVTTSEYVRHVLIDSGNLSAAHRLILAEVCACRRELETLLKLISDLTNSDIEHAREDADHRREALVAERLLEQRDKLDRDRTCA